MSNAIGVWFYSSGSPLDVRDDGARWTGVNGYGYGSRIRTSYTVRWNGRWRRVYVCQWGATGAYYINVKGDRVTLSTVPARVSA
jgi:hypothetical protein